MCHLPYGNARKQFDLIHPDFASDPRNMKFGLCAD